ncbi:hypothetical protein CAPTEDRAFT_123583, partial [Capitella teleta]
THLEVCCFSCFGYIHILKCVASVTYTFRSALLQLLQLLTHLEMCCFSYFHI